MQESAKLMIENTAKETRITGSDGVLKIVVKSVGNGIMVTKKQGGILDLTIEEAKALRIALDYEIDKK